MKAIFTQLSVKDLESLLKEFCKGIKVFFFIQIKWPGYYKNGS